MTLASLLRPRSIAVIGASDAGQGGRVVASIQLGGFAGPIYPVNPRRSEVFGLACYPDIGSVPGPVDLAYLATPAHTVLGILDELAAARVPAAIVYATGFADTGEEGRQLQEQLAQRARSHGIALLGPSSMGYINGLDRTCPFIGVDGLADAGSIGVISQSAGFIDSIRTSGRDLRPGILVATGNEAVLTAADVLCELVEDQRLRVLALALEGGRAVPKLRRALARAHELGKPVVVLKVGSSERGRQAALSHTGSLVGDDEVWEAFFRREGVVRVRELDELIETLALFAGTRRPGTGKLALIGTSGGKATYYADLCERLDVALAHLTPSTIAELREILGPGYSGLNPVDGGIGGVLVDPARFPRALATLCRDPDVAMVGVYGDFPVDQRRHEALATYTMLSLTAAAAEARQQAKPVFFVNSRSARQGGADPRDPTRGVPILHGASEAILAAKHSMAWAPRKPEGAPEVPETAAAAAARHAVRSARERGLTMLLSADASELLDGYGIARAPERIVHTDGEVLAACDEIGYPVVLKVVSPAALHKSDAGLVALDVGDCSSAQRALRDLRTRAAPIDAHARIAVQRMVPAGVEVIAGLKVDPDVGPVLLFGLGGILVEILRRVRYELLPLGADDISTLVRQSPAYPILRGARGRPPADIAGLERALAGVARLGWDLRHDLAELDINPLIVRPEGVWAIDVRVVLAPAQVGRDRDDPGVEDQGRSKRTRNSA